MVRSAFNQGSYQGIRSLPNALKPDFRRQLYEKILEHAKVARQTRQTRQPGEVQLEAAVRRAPRPTAQGQWRPGKFSSVPSYFSVFEYMDDPIGRVKDCLREEAERSKKLWLSEEDFKTQALPPVPSHAGSFNEFEYAIDPFEGRDEYLKGLKDRDEQKVLHGPIRAGGCVATSEQTKIRANEAVESLRDTVGRAWPEVFVDAFQDSAGCLVLCFDRVRAEESGAARGRAVHEPPGALGPHRERVLPEEGLHAVGGDGRGRPRRDLPDGLLRAVAALGAQAPERARRPAADAVGRGGGAGAAGGGAGGRAHAGADVQQEALRAADRVGPAHPRARAHLGAVLQVLRTARTQGVGG